MNSKIAILVLVTFFSAFVECKQDFAVNLYRNLPVADNIVYAPSSIKSILSIISLGAYGKTASEIDEVLGFNENTSTDEKLSYWEDNSSTYVGANRIYVTDDVKLDEEFQESVKKYIGYTIAERLNFNDNVQAAQQINYWVYNRSHHEIKEAIESSVIAADTRLVMVNAIYFKNNWLYEFSKEKLFTAPFYLNENDMVSVEYMNLKKDLSYNRFPVLEASVVELPYYDNVTSMILMLPNEKTGLQDLIKRLATVDLDADIFSNLILQQVDVSIPRFKIESSINLNEPLKAVGIQTMFTAAADFRRLLDSPEPLEVSSVVHKAVIEVDEKGTVATAITEAVLINRCAPQCEFFEADHPFLFFIYNRVKKHIIFMGQYSRPQ